MSLLVFGATGQVARELARRAPEAVFLSRTDVDLADPEACMAAITDHAPTAVINAAAYTAVDRAEDEETLATAINATAPAAMANACAARDIPFVHISTDYVFDGSGDSARAPDAPTAPINAYGRSKLAGEEAVRLAGGRWAVLRTSWVFSAHGANFVKTMLRLSESRDALNIVARPDRRADLCGAHCRSLSGHGAGAGPRWLGGGGVSLQRGAGRKLGRFRLGHL